MNVSHPSAAAIVRKLCRSTLVLLAVLALAVVQSTGVRGSQFAPAGQPPARDPTTPPSGSGMLLGRVVGSDRQPLRGALVTIGGSPPREVITDDNGRFAFDGLAAGRYNLNATKPAFVVPASAIPIDIAAGQRVDYGDLLLERGGVIAGRVLDQRGREVTGADVTLYRLQWDRGRALLGQATRARDQTDDLGQYRLFGIPPGEYLLGAVMPSADQAGEVATYYPSASSPSDAETISIRSGDELSEVLLTVNAGRAGAISGKVRRSDGVPVAAARVSLSPFESQVGGVRPDLRTVVRPDGSFTFRGLPPGEYIVSVDGGGQPGGASMPLFAHHHVRLDGANVQVALELRAGGTLSGRFSFEGGTPSDVRPPSAQSLASGLLPLHVPAPFSATRPEIRPDWTFEIHGLFGRKRFVPPTPAGWFVKAILRDNTAVTDTDFDFDAVASQHVEVVLTQRVSRLTVVPALGDPPTSDATVVIFPEDDSRITPLSRYVQVRRFPRTTTSRAWTFTNVPPGRYLAVAFEGPAIDDGTNPALLRRLRAVATPVDVREGAESTIQLPLSRMP